MGAISPWKVAAVAVLTAALAVSLPVAAQQTPPAKAQAKVPVGNLEVTVELDGGGALQSCSLYLRDKALELGAGKTTAVFEGMPQSRYTIAGDAKVKTRTGAIARYVAIQPVSVNAGKSNAVTLKLSEVASMDEFCSRCHPAPGEPSQPGQIVRDLHVSGKVLESGYLTKVAKHNAAAEQLAKQGRPHNLPIILEKRNVVEGGKTVERDFFTCESCHTLHWSRVERSYVRAPFYGKPDLCVACH